METRGREWGREPRAWEWGAPAGRQREWRASVKATGPVSPSEPEPSAEPSAARRRRRPHLVTGLPSVGRMKARPRPPLLRTLPWFSDVCRENPKSLQRPARPCPADPCCSSGLPQPVSLRSLSGSSHAFWSVPGTLMVALLPAKLFSAVSVWLLTFFREAISCPPPYPHSPFLIYLLLFHSAYQHPRGDTMYFSFLFSVWLPL